MAFFHTNTHKGCKVNISNNFDISGNGNSVTINQTINPLEVIAMILKFTLALIALLLSPVLVPVLLLAQRNQNRGLIDG